MSLINIWRIVEWHINSCLTPDTKGEEFLIKFDLLSSPLRVIAQNI